MLGHSRPMHYWHLPESGMQNPPQHSMLLLQTAVSGRQALVGVEMRSVKAKARII